MDGLGYHHDSGNLQMSGVISLRQDAGLIHPFLEENHLSVPWSWVVPRTMDFHGFPIQNLQFLWFRYPPQICSDTSSGGLYLLGSRELFGGCGCQLSDQENASFFGRCDGYNWCIKGKHGKIMNCWTLLRTPKCSVDILSVLNYFELRFRMQPGPLDEFAN